MRRDPRLAQQPPRLNNPSAPGTSSTGSCPPIRPPSGRANLGQPVGVLAGPAHHWLLTLGTGGYDRSPPGNTIAACSHRASTHATRPRSPGAVDAMTARARRCRQSAHTVGSHTGSLRAQTKKHRHAHADDPARARCGRGRGTGRKVRQVATARQLSSGGYLVQLSETELALIRPRWSRTSGCRAWGSKS
jgi:hypothetical protein